MKEFDLIARYFSRPARRQDVLLGVGDDAAVLAVPEGRRLVAAVDTIVAGVHFPESTSPDAIAHRALAVNLSDLAAMGAEPAWFTLSLSLPQSDPDWLARFSSGLYALAQQHNIELVGGDTVRGQLSISVQVLGLVELDGWLVRSGAAVRDSIYVSGCPGEAAGGLASIQQHLNRSPETDYLKNVFEWPTPRVQLGRALRRVASAAIDISDGLIADLVHICERSHVGACIDLSALPRSKALETMFDRATCERFSLSGGDDYELLFTAPSTVRVASIAEASKVVCTSIGRIVELGTAGTSQSSPVVCMRNGQIVDVGVSGYDHFA